eukprot:237733-Chlamydomonas_euryale.AAC.14
MATATAKPRPRSTRAPAPAAAARRVRASPSQPGRHTPTRSRESLAAPAFLFLGYDGRAAHGLSFASRPMTA